MFFITTITTFIDKNTPFTSEEYKKYSTRCVGYYKDVENARYVVHNNAGDIWETIYRYAIIEEVAEGLYPSLLSREWFEYNVEKNKYEPINELEKPIYPKSIG